MKTSLARYALLFTLLLLQQGAFAVAFHEDVDPDHLKTHGAGTPCENATFLSGASGVLPSSMLAILPVAQDRLTAPAKLRAVFLAATIAFRSRAPPTLL